MDPRAELQEKLAYLNSKLSESPESQNAEERQKHLKMLQDVMNAMASMEKDLKKAVNDSNPDACTLRVVASFPRAADGGIMYPHRKDIQEKLNRIFRENVRQEICIEVQAKFVEMNFNYILHYPAEHYLREEEEFYIKVGSPEQMESILKFSDNFRRAGFEFMRPTKNFATREAYQTIGHLLLRLKIVDQKCRKLGAIPGRGGVPVLPDNFVQREEFVEAVKTFMEKSMKEELHGLLCSRTPVDKRKRQTELDPLVDERIDILQKLLSFNQDDYPFTFERVFK
jgi:hypothetical protein